MVEEHYSWEEPYTLNDKTEPVQSFEAFKVWVEMGSSRSLKAVAERMEKSHDTIKHYSCTWKWSERLQDKLSYENKVIHGKQLEQVMTSLDIDSRRDMITQMTMGNILQIIQFLSMIEAEGLKRYYSSRTKKFEQNPNLELMERLVNLYVKLDNTHTKTQQKLIDYNTKCLTYQNFNDVEEYREMLKHGQKQFNKIMSVYCDDLQKKGKNKTGTAGLMLFNGKIFESYTPGEDNSLEEVDGEKQLTEIPEEISGE